MKDEEMNGAAQPNTERKPKRRNRLFGCVVAGGTLFLVSITVLAFGLAIYSNWLDRRIAELEHRIRDKGQPVTLDELAATYPEVPDEENAALAYSKALTRIEEIDPNMDRSIGLVLTLHDMNPEEQPPEWLQNAIANTVNELDSVYALLEEATEKKRAQFEIDFSRLMQATPPHVVPLRNCARVESLRLRLALENNDSDLAARSQKSALHLAEVMRLEPVTLSQLVRISIFGITVDSLGQYLNHGTLHDDDARKLMAVYAEAEDPDAIIRTFIAERCVTTCSLESMLTDNTVEGTPIQKASQRLFPMYHWLQRQLMAKVNRIRLLTKFEPLVELEDEPWKKRIEYWSEHRPIETEVRPSLDLSRNLIPPMYEALPAFARGLALLRMARTALAIELYRSNYGHLPADLDALVPEYLPEVPEDPFDGKPMRYVKLPQGYKLYTVFANLQDDGGRQAEPSEGSSYDGDWVFEVRR
jgi:hypothetical protein